MKSWKLNMTASNQERILLASAAELAEYRRRQQQRDDGWELVESPEAALPLCRRLEIGDEIIAVRVSNRVWGKTYQSYGETLTAADERAWNYHDCLLGESLEAC